MSVNVVELDVTNMRGIQPLGLAKVPVKGWIAGGAIRGWFTGGEKLSDIDTFFPNQKSMEDYIAFIQSNGYTKLDEHKNAVTFSDGKT